MKQIVLMMAVVMLVGCGESREEKSEREWAAAREEARVVEADRVAAFVVAQDAKRAAEERANSVIIKITDPIIKEAICKRLDKPYGKFAPPVVFTRGDLTHSLYGVHNLDLYDTEITDAGLKDVAKLESLTRLYLSGTQITDAGLKEVAKLQQLRRLGLRRCTQITDAGLKDVAKLQKLVELDLAHTRITDEGIKDVVKLRKLLRLSLFGTRITDAGLKDLAKLEPIQHRPVSISLGKTQVTAAGVGELRKAFPRQNVTIHGGY